MADNKNCLTLASGFAFDYKNIYGVGKITNEDFFEMLHNSVGAKKIMVTYDSVKRLCSLINPKDYKILIDEAHQLVNIGLYRKGAVHKVLSCFRDFKEFVFITATATSFKFFPAELRDIEFIDIHPEFIRSFDHVLYW